jgi:hypothetical protein
MKNTKISGLSTGVCLVAILSLVSLSFQSCANKFTFEKSIIVPAAEGYVKVKKDKNTNYSINLHVRRLARPDRLTPPKVVYVFWLLSEGNVAQNIGKVRTSTGFLSKSLKSSFHSVAPFKPTGFMITAEEDANIQYPGTTVVLKTPTM